MSLSTVSMCFYITKLKSHPGLLRKSHKKAINGVLFEILNIPQCGTNNNAVSQKAGSPKCYWVRFYGTYHCINAFNITLYSKFAFSP
jgi:hypothetical protein